jgi:hypothetical protein
MHGSVSLLASLCKVKKRSEPLDIDWNSVGVGRRRRTKWWIKVNKDNSAWKEYAFVKDNLGQQYYFEPWEQWNNGVEKRKPITPTRLAL